MRLMLVLLVSLSGCSDIEALRTTTIAADKAAIARQSERFSAAYVANDIETLLSIYTSDAVIAPPERPFLSGSSLRNYWQQPAGRQVTHHAVRSEQIVVRGDVAYDWGQYEGAAGPIGKPQLFRGKYLIVWERSADGVWQMAQDMWNDLPSLASLLGSSLPSLVERVMEEEHIPGAAVVVVQNGRPLFQRGFGVADVRSGRPVDPERTVFRIGSVSKAMTAWALTRLIDQGQLTLDDPVARYVPRLDQVPNDSGSTAPVLIRHLLTHTGGFDQIGLDRQVRDFELPLAQRLSRRPTLEQFLFGGNLRRTSAPGQHYRYDTYGITLAGLVLETVTKKPYGEAMHDVLFEPLGMVRASVALDRAGDPDMAVGHGWVDGGYGVAPYEVYVTQPASSVDLTATDMAKLMAIVTSQESADGTFSPAMRRALMAPQFRPHPDFPGVTHGMNEVARAGGRDGPLVRGVGHGGSMLGFSTQLMFLPDYDLGVFIVANRNIEAGGGPVSLHDQVIQQVVQLAIGESEDEVYPDSPRVYAPDLERFAGRYAYGVFCRSCTADELTQGAWQPYSFLDVDVEGNELLARDLRYHATNQPGVFVSEDRRRKLYFAVDPDGVAKTVSFAGSPDTFERLP